MLGRKEDPFVSMWLNFATLLSFAILEELYTLEAMIRDRLVCGIRDESTLLEKGLAYERDVTLH